MNLNKTLGKITGMIIAQACIDDMQKGWTYQSIIPEGEEESCNTAEFQRADENDIYLKPIVNGIVLDEEIRCSRKTFAESFAEDKIIRIN